VPEGRTEHIRVESVSLSAGESVSRVSEGAESVIVLLSGVCTLSAGGTEATMSREGVFGAPAFAVYVPAAVEIVIAATEDTELAWCAGMARPGGEVVVIAPEDVKCRTVGRDTYERTVCDIVGLDVPAQHLVVGETFNQPGKWSSYPPHRHDEDRLPDEADMEEVYLFKVDPPQGFGMQRLYSPEADFDRAVVIKDGSVVEIPEGYHPVCAAPGCDLYYLWVLWGEQRILAPFDDPDFGPVKERL